MLPANEDETEEPDRKRRRTSDNVFSGKTLVPLGAAGAIAVTLMRLWLFLIDADRVQSDAIKDLQRRIDAIEKTTWTCDEHRSFYYELRIYNPTLNIPNDMNCGRRAPSD